MKLKILQIILTLTSVFIFISGASSRLGEIDQRRSNSSLSEYGENKVLSDTTGATSTPTPYCTAPTNGCGSNYYWDSSSCSCKPSTSGCVSPSGGCPSGFTFNTSTCSCTTTTCVSPTYGCGSNYYWDSGSCSCKQSSGGGGGGGTSCVSPTFGCGTNYTWNTGSCSCVYNTPTPTPYSSGSSCVSPTYGCGTNYYWDSGSCSCKQSSGGGGGGTSCVSPTYGCSTNYTWNATYCSCLYNTPTPSPEPDGSGSTCVSPTFGCGTNYYWDTGSCTCKYNSSNTINITPTPYCASPSAGCGTNYYWDSNYCSCRPTSTTALCSVPSAGCGTGWYWDQGACVCKSATDPQTYYSTNTMSTTSTGYMDRFSYEPPERIVCIKSFLSDSEYQTLRYYIPASQSDYDNISKLGEKVRSCWGIISTTNSSVPATTTQPAPISGDKCVLNNIGAEAYKEIYDGQRTPSYEEHLVFDKCYGKTTASTITFITSKQQVPPVTDSCLKSVLGSDLYLKVKSGKSDVPSELRVQVDRCFGTNPQPFEQGRSYKIPDEIKSCLLQSIGQARFDLINSGKGEPTADEKKTASACFTKLNQTEKNFLPPPPDAIHYSDIKPSVINLSDVTQNNEVNDKKIKGGEVVFKGKGPANSTVYIYIFSEPVVVTTKTDENGDWVYELSQPLSGEKHIAYAAVKHSDGAIVRSGVFNFNVIAAETDLANNFINENETTKPVQTNFMIYYLLIMVCAITAISMIYFLFFRKKLNKLENQNNDQDSGRDGGDTKGNAGTGTVN